MATPAEPAAPAQPAAAPAKPATPAEPAKPGEEGNPATPAEPAKPGEQPKPGEGEAQPAGKVSPWKLLDESKAARAKLEKQLEDVRKLVPDEAKRRQEIEHITALEKRNQELEAEIRFHDYSKSSEFVEKYQKPYEAQWKRTMSELSGITIETEDGSRPMKSADMLQLVNMPTVKARAMANELYGDFADDVMQHRDKIRGMFEQQSEALERAKSEGVERANKHKSSMTTLASNVKSAWDSEVSESLKHEKHGKYFTPVDGDDDGNAKLERGFALVDKAFSQNPMNPNLTDEQRAQIVKAHVAVRNRAAAYSRVVLMLEREQAAHKATMEKLSQYESSAPETAGTPAAPNGAPAAPMKAKDRLRAGLEKIAR